MADAGYACDEAETELGSEPSRLNSNTPVVAEVIEDGELRTEEAVLIVPPKKT